MKLFMWQINNSASGLERVKIVNVIAEDIARARELVSGLTMDFGKSARSDTNSVLSHVQTVNPKHTMRLSNPLEQECVLDLLVY